MKAFYSLPSGLPGHVFRLRRYLEGVHCVPHLVFSSAVLRSEFMGMWEQPCPLETDTVSVSLFMVPWKPNAGLIINIFSLSCLKACMGVQLWSVICSYIWNENEERGQPFWRFNSERLAHRDNLMCMSNLEGCSAQWALRAPFPQTVMSTTHSTLLHFPLLGFTDVAFCFCSVFWLFTNWRFVASLPWASLLASFLQQRLLTLRLWVTVQ